MNSNITSRDLADANRRNRPRRSLAWNRVGDLLVTAALKLALTGACVLGLGFAAYLWFFGAGWTISGAPLLANLLLDHLSALAQRTPPMQIHLPLPWTIYLSLWTFPVLFSLVELFGVPLQQTKTITGTETRTKWIWLGNGLAVVYVIVIGLDLSSTFLGLYNPQQAGATLAWLARGNLAGAAISTMFFTFFPEWLARALLASLRTVWRA